MLASPVLLMCPRRGSSVWCLGTRGFICPPRHTDTPSTAKLPTVLLWVSAGDSPDYGLPESGLVPQHHPVAGPGKL